MCLCNREGADELRSTIRQDGANAPRGERGGVRQARKTVGERIGTLDRGDAVVQFSRRCRAAIGKGRHGARPVVRAVKAVVRDQAVANLSAIRHADCGDLLRLCTAHHITVHGVVLEDAAAHMHGTRVGTVAGVANAHEVVRDDAVARAAAIHPDPHATFLGVSSLDEVIGDDHAIAT